MDPGSLRKSEDKRPNHMEYMSVSGTAGASHAFCRQCERSNERPDKMYYKTLQAGHSVKTQALESNKVAGGQHIPLF